MKGRDAGRMEQAWAAAAGAQGPRAGALRGSSWTAALSGPAGCISGSAPEHSTGRTLRSAAAEAARRGQGMRPAEAGTEWPGP